MGGTKRMGAFAKNSQEATTLLQMFLSDQLDVATAAPGDVHHLFPTLHDKTATQFRSGFHRIKELARESKEAVCGNNNGNFFFFKYLFFFCQRN
jgi:hypothetical protein